MWAEGRRLSQTFYWNAFQISWSSPGSSLFKSLCHLFISLFVTLDGETVKSSTGVRQQHTAHCSCVTGLVFMGYYSSFLEFYLFSTKSQQKSLLYVVVAKLCLYVLPPVFFFFVRREEMQSRHTAGDAFWTEAVRSGSSSPRESPAQVLRAPETLSGSETLLPQVHVYVGPHSGWVSQSSSRSLNAFLIFCCSSAQLQEMFNQEWTELILWFCNLL